MKEAPPIPARNVRGKKTRNPGYEPGNHWVICDICGCAIRAKDARFRWDNAVVCPDDWEPRHPQDFVYAKADKIIPDEPIRPEGEPVFVANGTSITGDDTDNNIFVNNWFIGSSGTSGQLNAVESTSSAAIIAGNDAVLLRSTDDGETWVAVTSQFTSDHVNDVHEENGIWVAVGESGKRSYSTDSGATWTANHDSTVTASALDQKYESASAGVNTEALTIIGEYMYVLKNGDNTPDLFRYNLSDGTLESTVATNISLLASGDVGDMAYNPLDELIYCISETDLWGTMEIDGTNGTSWGVIPGLGTGFNKDCRGLVYADGFFYTIYQDRNFSPSQLYIQKRNATTSFNVVQSWRFDTILNDFNDPDSGGNGPISGQTYPTAIGYEPSTGYIILSGFRGSLATLGAARVDISDTTPAFVDYKWYQESATDNNGCQMVFDIPNNLFYKCDRNLTYHAYYWSDQTTANFNGVYGNGSYFVSVADVANGAGVIDYIAQASVGSGWIRVLSSNHPFTGNVYGIAYGGSLWVAVGASGVLATSSDLTAWTQRTSSFSATSIYNVNYGDGYFVAVGGSGKIAKSLDGVTWVQQISPFDSSHQIDDVYWNGSFWTAVSFAGEIGASYNGEDWFLVTDPFGDTEISGVVFNNNIGIACGWEGKIATSPTDYQVT